MQTELMTSDVIKITIMAYERCIVELRFAKDKMEALHFSEAAGSLLKVEQIIHELSLQLNHEAMPELAGQISDLYDWIIREIHAINTERKAEKIDPIIRVIKKLLDGYQGAVMKQNGNN